MEIVETVETVEEGVERRERAAEERDSASLSVKWDCMAAMMRSAHHREEGRGEASCDLSVTAMPAAFWFSISVLYESRRNGGAT